MVCLIWYYVIFILLIYTYVDVRAWVYVFVYTIYKYMRWCCLLVIMIFGHAKNMVYNVQFAMKGEEGS